MADIETEDDKARIAAQVWLQNLAQQVATGEVKGLVVYVNNGKGAQFRVSGRIGIDDLCMLASRAMMASHEMYRHSERFVAESNEKRAFSMQ